MTRVKIIIMKLVIMYMPHRHSTAAIPRSLPPPAWRALVVRLRSGGTLKDEDVAGATVLLGNENLLIIADIDPQTGALTAHVPTENGELPPQTITPHRCADTPTGFVEAYEACCLRRT